jgi:signal peptidase
MTALTLSPVVAHVATTGKSVTRRAGRAALNLIAASAVVLFVFLAIGPRFLPYRTVTMLSGSMRPVAPVGSVLVDVAEPVSALEPGQVISFHAPVPGRPVVSHRVIEVQHRDGQVLVRTKGDANSAADPWLAVVHGNTVWRMRAVIPGLGTAVRTMRTRMMRPLLLYAVPGALLLWLLVAVWRRPAAAAEAEEGGDASCVYPDEAQFSPRQPSPCSVRAPSRPGRRRRQRRRARSSSRRPRSSLRRR